MIPLLRTAALAVAAALVAWPVAGYLDDSESRTTRTTRTAPAAVTTVAPVAALPWSATHHAGPGELDVMDLDRIEASLTRLYAIRKGERPLV